MNKNEHINKIVDETLNSLDGAGRATVKPYLLTRINARLNRSTESVWEKAGWFIGRPAVAFTGLCVVVLINLMVVMSNGQKAVTVSEQSAQTQTDEFSYTVATIYDIENTQP